MEEKAGAPSSGAGGSVPMEIGAEEEAAGDPEEYDPTDFMPIQMHRVRFW